MVNIRTTAKLLLNAGSHNNNNDNLQQQFYLPKLDHRLRQDNDELPMVQQLYTVVRVRTLHCA